MIDFSNLIEDIDNTLDELEIITVPPSSTDTLNTLYGGYLEPISHLVYEYFPPENPKNPMIFPPFDFIHSAAFNTFGEFPLAEITIKQSPGL